MAEQTAELLGCSGAHEVDGGWSPCESPLHLETIINDGVAKYRLLPSEKGLIGRAIGAVRGTSIPGRRGKKKIRRVGFDRNARDADADNLVQEGTNQERTISRAASRATRAPAKPKTRPVRRGRRIESEPTEVPSIEVPVKTPKAVEKAPKARGPKAVVRDMAANAAIKRGLKIVDDELDRLGALGRPRDKADGPMPEAETQAKAIKRLVDRKYGQIKTLNDAQLALEKAFPNANVFARHINFEVDDKNLRTFTTMFGKTPFTDIDEFDQYFGKGAFETYRGTVYGLLYLADNDPKSAEMVGHFHLLPDRDGAVMGMVGVNGSNTVKRPFSVAFNPAAMLYNTNAMEDDAELVGASLTAAAIATDPDKFVGKKFKGQSGFQSRVVDGDRFLTGLSVAAHEWGHLSGFAAAAEDLDLDNALAPYNEWIKNGKPGVELDFPEYGKLKLDGGVLAMAVEVNRFLEGMRDPVIIAEAQRALEYLGFTGVDVKDPQQMMQVYRALIVRSYVNTRIYYRTTRQSGQLTQAQFRELGRLSGYGMINKEEAVAELYGLLVTVPYTAYGKFKDLYTDPILKKRLER